MKTAVIYARVSTNRQADEGMSIDAQIKQLRDYAADNEYEVVYEYIDRGESAKTADRTQFQQMISDIKSAPGDYDAVLIHKTDRFARNREDSIVYKSLLRRDCDCDVIAIAEDFGDGPIGKMIEGILEVIAEFYSENLSKEVLKGMTEKAQTGKLLGKVAYGYYNEDGNIKVHENESEVVKWIFNKYTKQSWGTQKIAYEIRHNGPDVFGFNTNIKANGDEMAWRTRTIRRMLRNEFYIGTYSWNETRIENNHPAIIEENTFKLANDLLSKRANSVTGTGKWGEWLYSGVLKCYECGYAMSRKVAPRKTIDDVVYIRCARDKQYNECYGNWHRLDNIEPRIVQFLEDISQGKIDTSKLNFKTTTADISTKKSKLQKQLDNIDSKFDKQMKAYEADVITLDQLQEYKERLENEKEALKERIDNLDKKSDQGVADQEEFKNNIGNLAETLSDDDLEVGEKRQLLIQLIHEVHVSEKENKIEIYFKG